MPDASSHEAKPSTLFVIPSSLLPVRLGLIRHSPATPKPWRRRVIRHFFRLSLNPQLPSVVPSLFALGPLQAALIPSIPCPAYTTPPPVRPQAAACPDNVGETPVRLGPQCPESVAPILHLWGAHAPRVLVTAPRRHELFCIRALLTKGTFAKQSASSRDYSLRSMPTRRSRQSLKTK
jgi:hypothetical protein